MRTTTLVFLLAACSLAACSSGSDADTGSGGDATVDTSADSQASEIGRDVGHDGDATMGDSAHGGDSTGGDAGTDSTLVGDSASGSDTATGTDTTWTPDGDCDLPPAPIVDCSHATPGASVCSGPPPDYDAGTYDIGCTAVVPETSGTTCGPLHCTCTDLGSAGAGWTCG